jgi:dimethylaniline monooxygenase (N-oxide forming)
MNEPTHEDRVCVIGGGSSGIVAVKVLSEAGIEVDCFERGSGIGGNWRYQNDNGMSAAYRSLHINTSKTRMAYADYPMPDDYPDYPHHSEILAYFEDYVDHFGIRPLLQFESSVERVRRADGGGFEVIIERAGERRSARYRAVLVANGHHWDAKWPDFPGDFSGRVLHSHEYETPDGFEEENVLVVGIGNSGVDIACEASRVARQTWLSTRRSAHVLPKYAFGQPIDLYTTPFSSRLPLFMQRLSVSAMLRMVRGPQQRFGLRVPDFHVLQTHPTVSADLLNLVGHGKVKIKPDVDRLDGQRVRFADGSEEEIDIVVYATGYKITFPFFEEGFIDTAENRVRLYRQVVHPAIDGLYFMGLVQPLGAVMPLAEAQSQWVAKLLSGECELPSRDTIERRIDEDLAAMARRYVTSTRHTIQVDFYPYLRTLREEIKRPRRRRRSS